MPVETDLFSTLPIGTDKQAQRQFSGIVRVLSVTRTTPWIIGWSRPASFGRISTDKS